MSDKTEAQLRTAAYYAALRRLRFEFPAEYLKLLANFRDSARSSQKALIELRRRHPERGRELYAEEVTARGLPAPRAVDRG